MQRETDKVCFLKMNMRAAWNRQAVGRQRTGQRSYRENLEIARQTMYYAEGRLRPAANKKTIRNTKTAERGD
jgi:hypothetical protein